MFVSRRCRLYEAQDFFGSVFYKYAAPTALFFADDLPANPTAGNFNKCGEGFSFSLGRRQG
jgi:hypothetical protein